MKRLVLRLGLLIVLGISVGTVYEYWESDRTKNVYSRSADPLMSAADR